MSEIDKMFDLPSEAALSPIVDFCIKSKAAGDNLQISLEENDSGQTKLIIHRKAGAQNHPPQQWDWDDTVNAALIDIGIRAIDFDHEGARFSRRLRSVLRKVERKYGDGYLNIVLVDLLDESNLGKDKEILDIRQYVHVNSASRGGSYNECRDAIAREISGRAVELRDKLHYSMPEAKTIMTKALAAYLDERFSVSSRKLFGLL